MSFSKNKPGFFEKPGLWIMSKKKKKFLASKCEKIKTVVESGGFLQNKPGFFEKPGLWIMNKKKIKKFLALK